MATFNTEVYNKQVGRVSKPAVKVDGLYGAGNVRYASVRYVASGTEAKDDVINLVKLPAGAVPVQALSRVVGLGVGGGAKKVDVGIASKPDLLAKNLQIPNSAHNRLFTEGQSGTDLKTELERLDGQETVIATVVDGGWTANAEALFLLAYIEE